MVEIETGNIIKRYAFWNPATWSIPKLYWDAWSQEQRVHAICRQLEKVIAYADYLGVNTDDIASRLKAIEDGQLDAIIQAEIEAWFEDNEPTILSRLDAVEDDIDAIKADNWVTTARIADGAVTNDKLAANSVDTSNIADNAVTTDKIVDNAVTADKIVDRSIGKSKIEAELLSTFVTANIVELAVEKFCDVESTSGYINSMDYDADTSVLYIASYNSDTTSTVRKYTNFLSSQDTTILSVDDYTFPNNHCNSTSFDDGKLYCWSWGANYVDEVNFSAKSYNRINVQTYLRGGAIKDGQVVLQPYNANFIEVSLQLHSRSPFLGMFNCVEVPSQVSWVQDSKLIQNCYVRLLSNGTVSNSYIEIIPIYSTANTPIVVPIPIAGEFEALAIIGNDAYVANTYDEIYKITDFVEALPQIQTPNLWSSEFKPLISNTIKSSGLPSVRQTSNIYEDFTQEYLVEIPEEVYQWTNVENLVNANVDIHFVSSSGSYAMVNIPLRLIGTMNGSSQGTSGGTYTCVTTFRSLANGIELLKCIVSFDNSTLFSGENNRHLLIAPTARITITGSTPTVSSDTSVITGVKVYLNA